MKLVKKRKTDYDNDKLLASRKSIEGLSMKYGANEAEKPDTSAVLSFVRQKSMQYLRTYLNIKAIPILVLLSARKKILLMFIF